MVGGLILQSPYLSIKSLAKSLVGPVLGAFVLNRFNNLKRIKTLNVPCLFIHGRKDKLIPHQHSVVLHEQCGAGVKYIKIVETADHNCFARRDVIGPMKSFMDLLDLKPSKGLGRAPIASRHVRGLQQEAPVCCGPLPSDAGWFSKLAARVGTSLATTVNASVALFEMDDSEKVDDATHPGLDQSNLTSSTSSSSSSSWS